MTGKGHKPAVLSGSAFVVDAARVAVHGNKNDDPKVAAFCLEYEEQPFRTLAIRQTFLIPNRRLRHARVEVWVN
jgi:hypothetical protein